jgi:hypothetical protein
MDMLQGIEQKTGNMIYDEKEAGRYISFDTKRSIGRRGEGRDKACAGGCSVEDGGLHEYVVSFGGHEIY